LWSDNWVCSKFPAGEPAEALAAALREREFTNLGADPIDPIVGPQRSSYTVYTAFAMTADGAGEMLGEMDAVPPLPVASTGN
jgi:hypothetical protein